MVTQCAKRSREEHTSTMPSAKRLKFSANIEEKIEILLKAVDNAVDHLPACQVMLASMVPGCLGPALDERDSVQMKAVDSIGKVILEQERVAREDVQRMTAFSEDLEVGKAAFARQLSAAREAVTLQRQVVAQRVTELKHAQMETDQSRQTMRLLSLKLQEAQLNKTRASDALRSFDQSCSAHFVPLKEGRFDDETQAMLHVDAVECLLKERKCEESLRNGFVSAAKLKPSAREHFDAIVVKEVGEYLKEALKNLREEDEAMDPVLRSVETQIMEASGNHDNLISMERAAGIALQSASAEERRAVACLNNFEAIQADLPESAERAKEILAVNTDVLEKVRAGPVAAFHFLKDRVKVCYDGRC